MMHNGSKQPRSALGVDRMALFLDLLLGHMLGDFLLQPGKLVAAKRDSWRGLLLHTSIVGATTALATLGTLRRDWIAVAAVAVAHLVIEKITILAYERTPTRGLFTLLFDQSLHLLSIAAVVAVVGGGLQPTAVSSVFGITLATRVLATVVGIVTVALGGSMLAFEAANALAPHGSKGSLLRLDLARIAGMVERGGSVGLALAFGPAVGPVAFAPRAMWAMTLPRDERRRQLAEAAAGLLLCAVVYFGIHAVATLVDGGTIPALSWPLWGAG
jgi:hypothetical protein